MRASFSQGMLSIQSGQADLTLKQETLAAARLRILRFSCWFAASCKPYCETMGSSMSHTRLDEDNILRCFSSRCIWGYTATAVKKGLERLVKICFREAMKAWGALRLRNLLSAATGETLFWLWHYVMSKNLRVQRVEIILTRGMSSNQNSFYGGCTFRFGVSLNLGTFGDYTILSSMLYLHTLSQNLQQVKHMVKLILLSQRNFGQDC